MNSRWHLLPAFALVTYGIIYFVYFAVLGYDAPLNASRATTARIAWAASVVPFVFSSLAASIVSIFVTKRHLPRWPRAYSVASWLVMLSVVPIAIVAGRLFPGQAAGFGRIYFVADLIASATTTTNGVFVWLGVILAVIACSTITRGIDEANVDELARRLSSFHLELLVCAAMLGSSVLESALLYRWGAAAYTGPDVGDYAGAVTFGSGLLFSGILVVGFMPVAVALGVRFDKLAARAAQEDPHFDIERWMLRHTLTGSPTHLFRTYLAMVSPLVIAATSQFLQSAGKPG